MLFLHLIWSTGGKKISLIFFFFFCDYHLFSSFVVVTMKERMKEVSLFSKDRKTLFLGAFEKSLFGVTKLSLGICED